MDDLSSIWMIYHPYAAAAAAAAAAETYEIRFLEERFFGKVVRKNGRYFLKKFDSLIKKCFRQKTLFFIQKHYFSGLKPFSRA